MDEQTTIRGLSLLILVSLILILMVIPYLQTLYRRAIVAKRSKAYIELDGSKLCLQRPNGRITIRRTDGVRIAGIVIFAALGLLGDIVARATPGIHNSTNSALLFFCVLAFYAFFVARTPMIIVDPVTNTINARRFFRNIFTAPLDYVEEITYLEQPVPQSRKQHFKLYMKLRGNKVIFLGTITGKDTPKYRQRIELFQQVFTGIFPAAPTVTEAVFLQNALQ